TTLKRRGQRPLPIQERTYTLWRGPRLLGEIIAWTGTDNVFSGPFVPANDEISIDAEWQTHMPAIEGLPALVARFPQPGQAHSIEFDTSDDDSVSEFQRHVVVPDDVLRVRGDAGDVLASSVHILEQTADATLPSEIVDKLPARALRGDRYWMVIVTLE